MSDTTEDAFTPAQSTELIRKQAENSAETVKDLGALADQSLAAFVMNALLLHERKRINLLDPGSRAGRGHSAAEVDPPPRGGRRRGSGDQDRLRRGNHRPPVALPASTDVRRRHSTDASARVLLGPGAFGVWRGTANHLTERNLAECGSRRQRSWREGGGAEIGRIICGSAIPALSPPLVQPSEGQPEQRRRHQRGNDNHSQRLKTADGPVTTAGRDDDQ